MKRMTIVLLSVIVALALASPIFGAGGAGGGGQTQDQKVPPFVEASVPDGKALIYIYSGSFTLMGSFGPLLLGQSGPIAVLAPNHYRTLVTEPGTIKLWVVSLYARELKLEAIAGQIYYVKAGASAFIQAGAPEIALIPNEKAMKEIAVCKQQDE